MVCTYYKMVCLSYEEMSTINVMMANIKGIPEEEKTHNNIGKCFAQETTVV